MTIRKGRRREQAGQDKRGDSFTQHGGNQNYQVKGTLVNNYYNSPDLLRMLEAQQQKYFELSERYEELVKQNAMLSLLLAKQLTH